jgi:hypothetical protein
LLPEAQTRTSAPIRERISVDEDTEGLTYFTHEIGGRLHAGWYRRISGRRIEVFTRTKLHREVLGELSLEEHARRILERLVASDDLSLEKLSQKRPRTD